MGGNAWPGYGRQYLREDGVTRTGPYFFDPAKADPNKVGGSTGTQFNPSINTGIIGGNMWENRNSVQVGSTVVGPISNYAGVTAVTQIGGKDVVYVGEQPTGGQGRLFRYTVNSLTPGGDSWQVVGSAPAQSYSGPGAGALDTKRNAMVRTSGTNVTEYDRVNDKIVTKTKMSLMYWNLNTPGTTNPLIYVTDLVGDPITITQNHGIDYSPELDAFVLWDGSKDLYLVYPPAQLGREGWSVRKITPSGDGPSTAGILNNGVFGKWNYMADSQAFMGVIDPVNGDIWVYRPDLSLANPSTIGSKLPTFRANTDGSRKLLLVNPTDAANPIIADDNISAGSASKALHIADGRNTAARAIASLQDRGLLYTKGDGLYRVDLLNGKFNLPIPVSSESQASQLCAFTAAAADYESHEDSLVVYTMPGADGNCATAGDNEYKMVNLRMGGSEAPLPAKRVVTALYDDRHTPIGWLAIDGGSLSRFDLDFSNPRVVAAYSGDASTVQALGVSRDNKVVMLKLGGQLRAYNFVSGALSDVLYTFTNTNESVLFSQDEAQTYFVDQGTGAAKIYRVYSDGSKVAALVVAETARVLTAPKFFSNNARIAYLLAQATAGNAVVRVMGKMGGSASSYTGTVAADYLEVVNQMVYYNVRVGTDTFKAGRIEAGGVNRVETANSRWVGSVRGEAGDAAAFQPIRLLKVTRQASSTDTDANGTLEVIDAANNQTMNISVIPAGVKKLTLDSNTGVGKANLLNAQMSPAASVNPIYFVNVDQAQSLVVLGAGSAASGDGNLLPQATIGGSSANGFAGNAVTFDGSASSDLDGSISAYLWNFGDGSTATTVKPSHVFATPGTYRVTLTVTDNKGGTGTASQDVAVVAPPPAPVLSFSTIKIAGAVDDPNVTQVKVNGVNTTVTGGRFEASLTANSGSLTVTIEAAGPGGTTIKQIVIQVP